jgi:hypothetical protein
LTHFLILALAGKRGGVETMTKYILILSVFLALALWYLLEHVQDCADNGYIENGVCVYE